MELAYLDFLVASLTELAERADQGRCKSLKSQLRVDYSIQCKQVVGII